MYGEYLELAYEANLYQEKPEKHFTISEDNTKTLFVEMDCKALRLRAKAERLQAHHDVLFYIG